MKFWTHLTSAVKMSTPEENLARVMKQNELLQAECAKQKAAAEAARAESELARAESEALQKAMLESANQTTNNTGTQSVQVPLEQPRSALSASSAAFIPHGSVTSQNVNSASADESSRETHSTPYVSAVLRLPQFWADKPALWFALVEAQFNRSRIRSDDARYEHVIGQLDCRFASEVEDIITNPPQTNRYETLKTELIRRLSLSQDERVKKLLLQEELGDRKPTQFLRHLRALAGTGCVDENMLRTLFMQRLPPHVQQILKTQTALTLNDLAVMADGICEVNALSTPTVAAVTSTDTAIRNLTQRFDELARQVASLTSTHRQAQRSRSPHPRSQSRGGGRSRSASRSDGAEDSSLCWYHRRFGDEATRCRQPCTRFNQRSENPAGSA